MIFTNNDCIGCNKCIRSCPVLGANVSIDNIIHVNDKMCISCGACFDNCNHNARDYEDDTEQFLSDLKNGKKYAVIVAPSFIANYPNDYKKIFVKKLRILSKKEIFFYCKTFVFEFNFVFRKYMTNYVK